MRWRREVMRERKRILLPVVFIICNPKTIAHVGQRFFRLRFPALKAMFTKYFLRTFYNNGVNLHGDCTNSPFFSFLFANIVKSPPGPGLEDSNP
jgi:hypothetical protein